MNLRIDRLDVSDLADHAFARFLPSELKQVVNRLLDVSLLAVPVNDSRVRTTAGVQGQKIRVARDKGAAFGKREWKDRLEIVRTEKVRVDESQGIKSAKSQSRCDRMINMLVNEKAYIHALRWLCLAPAMRQTCFF